MAESQKENKNSEEIIRVARERFKLAEEAEIDIRKLALEDLKFRAGDQWPESIKRERELEDRPCLTINKTPQYVRQITNDQRQNRPSIKVFPVDDKADIDTAKILQGLIRHIEKNSSADAAYDTAFEGAVTKGFGYYRVVTDYVDPLSFNQEILIKRIPNSFSVYLDPFSKEPDGSDANWGFIFEDTSKEDYKSEYKSSELASLEDWRSLGDSASDWIKDASCRTAEYFYKEYEDAEIVLLNNGETLKKSELPEILPDGLQIVDERITKVPVIKWCKINGIEVLEERVWAGKWIPIIPVYGDELNVDGKIIREGIIRHAKDSQRMYNYWASTETETITLAPKAPFIAAEGQIPKEYEAQWKNANKKNQAYLTYKPTSFAGQLVGAPQRNVFEPPVAAITNARMGASDDIKATTGIYDSSLGARSNETSGVAIRGRQAQAQTSNFHFIDNLTRSLRHTGRILVDLIPKIYDAARTERILGEDGEAQVVKINQFFEEFGMKKGYFLGAGKYDVEVETGPSFATKRLEAAASMMDFTKAIPQHAAAISDLIAKNMDWPGASEIAERLKKMLPPNLIDDKNKQPLPPEAKAQMDQMDQMIAQLTEKLNQATETIKTKSIELESKERIAFAQIEADLQKEMMKAAPNQALEVIVNEIAQINSRLQLLNINQPIEHNFNESGFNQAAIPNEFQQQQQQPTGGQMPGPLMGV